MVGLEKQFVDYYELLDVEPDASPSDIKKAYHKKLREFHPDKRKTSIHGLGHEISQQCNEAWEVLSDPAKRDAYDKIWVRNKKCPEQAKRENRRAAQRGPQKGQNNAEVCRREGNALYKAAVESRDSGADASVFQRKFQAALNMYSAGINLAPGDHKLLSNRALCYAALNNWKLCQQDALRVTQIAPFFMKGWFMLAKAFWKQGSLTRALQEIDRGLAALPACEDLIKLQEEIKKDISDIAKSAEGPQRPRAGPASRNPSPCQSRAPTPTPRRKASNSPAPPYVPPAHDIPKGPFVRGFGPTDWTQDDPPMRGRPPQAPGNARKASPSPCPNRRFPDVDFKDVPEVPPLPRAQRPESWRTPRDKSPGPGPPLSPKMPYAQGGPPPGWKEDLNNGAAAPKQRGRGSLAGMAAAVNGGG